MDIAIDFDGTVVTHDYPRVGRELEHCAVTLRTLAANGHRLILNTMRGGKELQDAVAWFKERDIPLYGVNKHPEQDTWASSPKVYASLYLDDAALGCPLTRDPHFHNRPFVDWTGVIWQLQQMNLLTQDDLIKAAMLETA